MFPETLGRPAGSVVDVFTDAGAYRGPMEALGIHVGRDAPPPVVRGGFLCSVVRDELGVEYLDRLRIEKPGSAQRFGSGSDCDSDLRESAPPPPHIAGGRH